MTSQQARAYEFIRHYWGEHKRSPSYEELKIEIGLASKAAVHRIVHGLESRGFVITQRYKARSITIRSTDIRCPNCQHCFDPALVGADPQAARFRIGKGAT